MNLCGGSFGKMARRLGETNQRLRVALSISNFERLDAEIKFLNLYLRSLEESENVIQSRGEFLRLVSCNWIARCLQDGIPEWLLSIPDPEEETVSLPLFLSKQSRSTWVAASRQGLGTPNEIINRALAEYFHRQVNLANDVGLKISLLKTALRDRADLSVLRTILG